MLVGVSAVIVRLSMEKNISHEVSWTVGDKCRKLATGMSPGMRSAVCFND
jgi:hypothetical protein